jgi:AraC-like DNA-binding protein
MVKIGQSTMPRKFSRPLERIRYVPPDGYRLDLEVMSVAELRRRGSAVHFRAAQRVDFHMLLGVTSGRFAHTVDFTAHPCAERSWIVLRPGQVQCFDMASPWDGWLVIFRPEFLLPLQSATALDDVMAYGSLEALPDVLTLSADEHAASVDTVQRMRRDARLEAGEEERDALIRHQLYALLLRLHVAQQRQERQADLAPQRLQRFRRFRAPVDAGFAQSHHVRDYARRLGCSERSLTRAVLEIVGVTSKAFLSQRIALEAKRRLAHTTQPVALIAAETGFDEASNFVKFFKRAAGCTPEAFSKQQRGE